MPRHVPLLSLAMLASCGSKEPQLEQAIVFIAPAECRMTPETMRIFDDMVAFDGTSGEPPRPVDSVTVPGAGAIRPSFRGPDADGMVHSELPLEGRWHGLTVTALGQGFVPNSGVRYERILFAEPAEAARERLNGLGFRLAAVGKAREFGDGMTEYIEIFPHGPGSALQCSS